MIRITRLTSIAILILKIFINTFPLINTIGVDYGVKGVNVGSNKAKVNFFDLSGSEDFRDIRIEFYENTQGVLMCYDASNSETFKKLQSSWVWEARSHGLNFYVVRASL